MEFTNFPTSQLKLKGRELHQQYVNNKPFPNIYVDDFFNADVLRKILQEFPSLGGKKEDIQYVNPNENKLASPRLF